MDRDYARLQMVNQQVRGWNVYDERVLDMLKERSPWRMPRELGVRHVVRQVVVANSWERPRHRRLSAKPWD